MSSYKINSMSSVDRISGIVFLLLFPGFYLYHQFVASGFLSPFLGGFFSPVCLIALVMYLLFWRHWLLVASLSSWYASFLIFFLAWTSVVSISSCILNDKDYIGQAFYQHMNAMLTWIVLVFLGAGINLKVFWFRWIAWLSGFLIFIILLGYVASTGSIQYQAHRLYDTGDGVASYQGFSRSAFILSVFLLAICKSFAQVVIVSIASIFSLFVLSARSEFIVILICVMALGFAFARTRPRAVLLLVSVSIVLFAAGYIFYDELSGSRHAAVLDLESDTSWITRSEKLELAWDRVLASPVFGEFGGHFESGGKGSYAHNVLSAWDSYGFPGIICYLMLVLCPSFDSARRIFVNRDESEYAKAYFLVSLSSVILVFASKAVFWPIPALAWGMFFGARRRYRWRE